MSKNITNEEKVVIQELPGENITPEESVVPIYLVPPTEEEVAERRTLGEESTQKMLEEEAKVVAKEAALAKLAKLGLTEEEARAVTGL